MTGMDAPEWGDEIGQKIVWFTGRSIQSAEIHLNPAELGPIDVKISVQNDTASVTFNAHNSSVRELLESNVTRLREMMEQNGVELQQVDVDSRQSDERYGSSGRDADAEGQGNSQSDDNEDLVETSDQASLVQSSSNIVDYFA